MESQKIKIKNIINSKVADDAKNGDKVLREIKANAETYNDIVLDFDEIELADTAFLNNAIGKLFDKDVFNLEECTVKVRNMNTSMMELLKETIMLAQQKYIIK